MVIFGTLQNKFCLNINIYVKDNSDIVHNIMRHQPLHL